MEFSYYLGCLVVLVSVCEVRLFCILKGERSSRSLFLPNLRNLIVMVTSSAYRVSYIMLPCQLPPSSLSLCVT